MTIILPADLERSIRAQVAGGQFASIDDAMAEAARLLLKDLRDGAADPNPTNASRSDDRGPGSIGALSEEAELLDDIVADAYRRRSEQPWRDIEP